MERESHIDALWENPDMGTPKSTPEISRDPRREGPLEETGLQIPTQDSHKKKDVPEHSPFNYDIPGDDEPDTKEKMPPPTLH